MSFAQVFSWGRFHCKYASLPKGILIVEFALLLPLILLLVFGLAEVSVALYNKTILTYASRDAVRSGVVAQTPRPSDAEIQARAQAYLEKSLLFYSPEGTVIEVEKPDSPAAFDRLRVTIKHQYAGIGLGRLLESWADPIVISATSVMTYE